MFFGKRLNASVFVVIHVSLVGVAFMVFLDETDKIWDTRGEEYLRTWAF